MVGKLQVEIGPLDFIKGSSSTNYLQDGGFSPSSANINLNITQGVVYSSATPANISTNLAGKIVASCENVGNAVSSIERAFVDDGANLYTLTGSTLTKQKTGSKTYTNGISFIATFGGYYYVSSANDVTQWDGTSTATETWFSGLSGSFGTLGSYTHPLVVFNKKLWIADGQYLHSWDGTTLTTEALDLGSSQVIIALGVDPGTGQMLISSSSGQDGSLLLSQPKYIWFYDGASVRPSRFIPVNDAVLSFQSVAGDVFVGTQKNIGIWTGNGIQSIHRLQNVTYDIETLPIPGHLTNMGNILYFTDGQVLYAYGETHQSDSFYTQKAFYPFYTTGNSANTIRHVCSIGSGKIAVHYNTTTPANFLYTIDTNAAGASGTFQSNRFDFPRPISLHRIRVFTTGITNTTSGNVSVIDENNNTIAPTQSYMIASGTAYVFDFDFGGKKLAAMQIILGLLIASHGLYRVIVYYDIAE